MIARGTGTGGGTGTTGYSGDATGVADAQIRARLVVLLRESVGEDRRWPADLGPQTRLDADLVLDSLEVAAFAAELRAHFGRRVDLLAHIAGLDLDAIMALTLADVARYVAARLADPQSADASSGDTSNTDARGDVHERDADRMGRR